MSGRVSAVYIGDAIPTASLHRAQAYVDLILHPPPAATPTSVSGGGRSRGHAEGQHGVSPHPFRQLLDALATAHREHREEALAALRRQDDGGASSSQAPPGSEEADSSSATAQSLLLAATDEGHTMQAPAQALADLQQQLGVYAGSAMYREWVLRPREHLQGVVRDIASAITARFVQDARLASLWASLREEEGDSGRTSGLDLDVHVQLLPSVREGSASAAAGLPHAPLCACVTVRAPWPLARREAEQATLAARLLSVAAAGQTVESALRFWAAVGYGDAADGLTSDMGSAVTAAAAEALREAGLEHYAPLGLDTFGSASDAAPYAAPDREGGDGAEDGRPGRRQRREGRGTAAESVPPAVVLPGTWASVSNQFTAAFEVKRTAFQAAAAHGPEGDAPDGLRHHLAEEVKRAYFDPSAATVAWHQPDILLTDGTASSAGGLRKRGRQGAGEGVSSNGRPVKLSGCGVLAVFYISVEGMAYLAYPQWPVVGKAPTRQAAEDPVKEPSSVVVPVVPPSNSAPADKADKIPFLGFPLEAQDSFTRGVLGL